MKQFILTALMFSMLPIASMAQDDLYFTPTKEQVKKAKETRKAVAKAREEERKVAAMELDGYYSGINKTDDEYNRRYRYVSKPQVVTDDALGDVIEFQAGSGDYKVDTTLYDDRIYDDVAASGKSKKVKKSYDYDNDYRYTGYMSRFDDFYGWYDPWFSPYWGMYHPYYGYAGYMYDPWFYGSYSPWYVGAYGWYDPWFNSMWGWYGPWYVGGWAWHSPWYYGHYGYGFGWGGYYDYGFYPGGIGHHVGSHQAYASASGTVRNRPGRGGFGHMTGGGSNTGNRGGSNSNVQIARRNGDAVTRQTNRANTSAVSRYQRSSNVNTNTSYERSYTPTSSFSSGSVGGGSSFSGGGVSRSGGGFSGGGGTHSGGRR